MRVRYQLFEFLCDRCGGSFKAPHRVLDDVVSLRSSGSGQLVVISTSDPLFDELNSLVARSPLVHGRSERQVALATFAALAAAVDPDPEGWSYVVGGLPRCERCGAGEPTDWRSTEPPETAELEVPEARHSTWDRLTEDRRFDLVSEAVADSFSA